MRGNNWDIFCRVVDNFGDIGVCWRLARQLASEHGLNIRLWVDDLASFRKLCPEIDAERKEQTLQGIKVLHWQKPFASDIGVTDIADVVIEAFSCELPDAYIAAMATRPTPPVWINLEYLSAEDWISGCHGLASPHPRLPLTKYFFFPGFVANSGGLLRETGLMRQHQAWQTDATASRMHFGLSPAAAGEILVSLFCYENPSLPALLQAWTSGPTPLRCLVPEGLALQQAAACLGSSSLRPGEQVRQGCLTLQALPFSSQQDYDRLLSLCDLNFVRGEDSFVRAQWAGKPLVWQIYPQEEDAHRIKLEAFLDLYCVGLEAVASLACRTLWQAWNGDQNVAMADAWPEFLRTLPELSAHASDWRKQMAGHHDLAGNLVLFCENLL
jgi:uncharacterized repeat protein (TIGR03837 family)